MLPLSDKNNVGDGLFQVLVFFKDCNHNNQTLDFVSSQNSYSCAQWKIPADTHLYEY